jgi:hypothetical protein
MMSSCLRHSITLGEKGGYVIPPCKLHIYFKLSNINGFEDMGIIPGVQIT